MAGRDARPGAEALRCGVGDGNALACKVLATGRQAVTPTCKESHDLLGCGFFLPAIGSFLLTVELFHLQSTILDLQIGAFLLIFSAFLLTIGVFCLQWESASKGIKGLQAKKHNSKQKSSNCN